MTDIKKEREKILRRIKQLLAMAEDVGSPHEAAIAARRAEVLMREHQLDQVDLLVNELDEGDVEITVVDHVQTIYGKKYKATGMPTWVSMTAYSAAKLNDCEADRAAGLSRFYGVGGDAQVAGETFRYLIGAINRLAKQYTGGRSAKNSFRRGAAGEVQDMCEEAAAERKAAFEATSTGKELVVLKKNLIEQRTGHDFSYDGGTSGSVSDGIAYYEGKRQARDNINLDPQISADKREQIK
jgi:hypothetical protein